MCTVMVFKYSKGRGLPRGTPEDTCLASALHRAGHTCLNEVTGWQISAYLNHSVPPNHKRGSLGSDEFPIPGGVQCWRKGCLL